jgi:hypothetical protein
MSASRQFGPEWVLSASFASRGHPREEINDLADAARSLWPSIQAHACKERSGKSREDSLALATEVWEGVLQSVAENASTVQRKASSDTRPTRLSLRCIPSPVQSRTVERAADTRTVRTITHEWRPRALATGADVRDGEGS